MQGNKIQLKYFFDKITWGLPASPIADRPRASQSGFQFHRFDDVRFAHAEKTQAGFMPVASLTSRANFGDEARTPRPL